MRKFYSNTGIRSEESRPKAIKSFGNKFLAKLYLLHCTGNDEKRKGEEPHHFILQRTTIRDSRQIQTSNKSFNVTDGIYKVVPSLLLPFLLSLSCGFSASWPQSEFYPPHDRSILTKFSLRPTRISSRISILSSRISRHCPSNVIVSGWPIVEGHTRFIDFAHRMWGWGSSNSHNTFSVFPFLCCQDRPLIHQ